MINKPLTATVKHQAGRGCKPLPTGCPPCAGSPGTGAATAAATGTTSPSPEPTIDAGALAADMRDETQRLADTANEPTATYRNVHIPPLAHLHRGRRRPAHGHRRPDAPAPRQPAERHAGGNPCPPRSASSSSPTIMSAATTPHRRSYATSYTPASSSPIFASTTAAGIGCTTPTPAWFKPTAPTPMPSSPPSDSTADGPQMRSTRSAPHNALVLATGVGWP